MSPENRLGWPGSRQRLETFRGKWPKPPLHPIERALLGILGIHLCFLPWALGTMHPWSQIASLTLAVAEFAVAMQVRTIWDQGRKIRLVPWVKLRRFPIFWIGAALLLLIAIQGSNHRWAFIQTPRLWWVVRVADVRWLPAGVSAPFSRFNAWRDFVIGAAAWLATCAVWVGLMRKQSLRILLGVLTVNGIVLALLGTYQHLSGDFRTPWPLTAMTAYPLNASFIYKNHAGAYFALVAFVAVALATWHYDRGVRALMKSTPAGALGLAAALLGASVLFTLSKGASLVLAGAVGVFAGWFLMRRIVRPSGGGTNHAVTWVVAAVLVLFALNAVRYLDFSTVFNHFDDVLIEGAKAESVHSRVLMHEADSDMLRVNWVRGVGAGGFRYLFPEYVRRYPDISSAYGRPLYWEHAHGDWWEVPIELGLAGDLLLLGGAFWWMRWFIRHRVGWSAFSVPILIGCAQTLIHATFDFPFQCPAILTTWCVLVAVAAKGVEP